VARGVDDSNLVLGGLELPESDVDGDTTLALSLEFVQNPGVLEGRCEDKNVKDANRCYSHLPSSAASFSNFSMVRLSIPPHL
jgi:hypothetical protein